ncbi:MAG: hypothetical protein ACTSPI_13555 [Candidatus Heimdallarchaeaceae archaeon]
MEPIGTVEYNVQIQVKEGRKRGRSRSFTVQGFNMDEVFEKIYFMFKNIESTEGTCKVISILR